MKVLSRSEEEFTRERNQDVRKVFRNLDPALHPMARAKEYTRALNGVKTQKIFSKPFVGALSGHLDSIACLAKNPLRLNCLVSGSMDGEVRLWDIAYKRTISRFVGHQRAVRGVAISSDGDFLLSCGDDCTVRLWHIPTPEISEKGGAADIEEEPVSVFQGKNSFRAIDHRWQGNIFATAGAVVDIWDHSRSEPINSFAWGADSIYSVRFNPSEPDVLATTASDRSIALYDLRMATPVRKVIMQTKSNSVAWNPREALNFTSANDDGNCYSYDMRNLSTASCIHKDHVSSVMDVDFSPTGREFATASYDRTVRIFSYNGPKSREVYHTKRMQRVFCVKFSGDASYIISGSDDANCRIWKASASKQLGVMLPREKKKAAYTEAVIDRYKHLPEISRIHRHRHVPRAILKADKLRHTMQQSERKKESRRRAHSAPDSIENVPARKKRIVAELE